MKGESGSRYITLVTVWFPWLQLQLIVARCKHGSLLKNIQGIRGRFALSVLFIHWCSSTTTFGSRINNFWLLVVHLTFTTANRVRLRTTDYLLSLSDTDTNSEHLPIADIANRESIHVWEGELNSLIHIAWQVHVCTPNKLDLFPFSIYIS